MSAFKRPFNHDSSSDSDSTDSSEPMVNDMSDSKHAGGVALAPETSSMDDIVNPMPRIRRRYRGKCKPLGPNLGNIGLTVLELWIGRANRLGIDADVVRRMVFAELPPIMFNAVQFVMSQH